MKTTSSLRMSADFLAVRELGPWLRSAAMEFSPDVGSIELALHELCINIIEHAYGCEPGVSDQNPAGSIDIICAPSATRNSITFTVRDSGTPFDGELDVRLDASAAADTAPEYSIRGYGLLILRQLAQTVSYERLGEINQWTIQFGAPSDEALETNNAV